MREKEEFECYQTMVIHIHSPLANGVSFSKNVVVHDERLSDCFKTNGFGETKNIHANVNTLNRLLFD